PREDQNRKAGSRPRPASQPECRHYGRLTRRVLPLCGGEDLAEDDFGDVLRRHIGALQHVGDHCLAEIMGGYIRERAVERTNRCPRRRDDDHIFHEILPDLRQCCAAAKMTRKRREVNCGESRFYSKWLPADRPAIFGCTCSKCSGQAPWPGVS